VATQARRAGICVAGILVILAGLLLAGCAGELPVPGQTSSTSTGGEPTTTTLSRGTELGDQIGSTWSEGIQKLVPLLEGTSPASSLQPTVAQLKEEYVQRMVALGREIDSLDQAGRGYAYDRAEQVLEGSAETDWFRSYVRLYDHYAAANDQASQDFAVLLSTFNTLTQYAFFELLKAQEPSEAERLGIE
jgi:hypothetical protein